MNKQAWVFDSRQQIEPSGPHDVIKETGKGWVKFNGRSAKQKCFVYYSEADAYMQAYKNQDSKRRRAAQLMARYLAKADALYKSESCQ